MQSLVSANYHQHNVIFSNLLATYPNSFKVLLNSRIMIDHIDIVNSRIMLDHINMVGTEFSICRLLYMGAYSSFY